VGDEGSVHKPDGDSLLRLRDEIVVSEWIEASKQAVYLMIFTTSLIRLLTSQLRGERSDYLTSRAQNVFAKDASHDTDRALAPLGICFINLLPSHVPKVPVGWDDKFRVQIG